MMFTTLRRYDITTLRASLAAIFLLAACSSNELPAPAPVPVTPTAEVVTPVATLPPAPVPGDTAPPKLAPPKPLTLPSVTERVLPNGLRLLIVPHTELPIADFILVVRSGSEADPARREGVASLTAAMLDEGTASRTSTQIAEQAAFLGISLSTSSAWDASRVNLHTPTSQLDSALALFADVALRPAFSARELERLRKERLTQILQIKDRGPQIADLAFNTILYGDDHPYGRWQMGTEASVKAITRANLQSFYNTNYRPNNATLIVVGDVNAADIEARVTRLFGSWKRGDVPDVKYGKTPDVGNTTVFLIDKKGAPQSSFRIGAVGVDRGTQDFFPLQVLNTILGGSFTSRLNQNLRETKGYTYGARSSFAMRDQAGPFQASAEIVAEKTDSALIEFFKELRGIRDTVPTSELEKAKQYLQLQLPQSFETTGDIAAGLVPVALYNLPLDYYNSYAQNIGQVSQMDLQRVAQQYLKPGNMAVVIVGDRTSIEAGIKAVNIGPVQIRDITGRPILQ